MKKVTILKAAYGIFKNVIDKMVDHSCDEKTERQKELYCGIFHVML